MDAVYTPSTQTISLISVTSHSSPSSSLSLSRIQSIRGEFLGCCHNLNPPGLRSRPKGKKVEFHRQLPRFRVVASFDSQPVLLVVAMATLSAAAAAVVYFNYYSKRKKSLDEISGPPTSGYIEEFKDASKQGFGSLILGIEALHLQHMEGHKHLKQKVGGSVGPVNGVTELLYQETASMHEETFNIQSQDMLIPSGHCQNANDSPLYRDREDTCLPLGVPVPVSGPASEFQFCGEEAELELMFPSHKDEMNSAASFSVNDAHEKAYSHGILYQDHDECELQKNSCNGNARKSGPEELYSFNEANPSRTEYPIASDGMTAVSSPGVIWESKNLYKPTGSSAQKLLQDYHFSTTGYMEGHRSHSDSKGDSTNEKKKLGQDRGRTMGNERTLLLHGRHKELTDLPHLNRMNINERSEPFGHLRSYNRLLRYGRLTECVELLEDMDRGGILDMNKVYHAKFFELCRSKKAVKESFRFAKLIPNPTLSTFNMLMSVCASAQDLEGAFQVQRLVQAAGFEADCKLYTTLISTCAKSGKVDTMFEVFHEMVNSGVEPNVHTYGALIDGCARAGQVAKAFGAYGMLRSKKVKPDRVVFNALITACGQSGAVDRAFDVLREMRAGSHPIEPDHVTVGALMKACSNAGQVDMVREVYKMIHQYNIKGTPEVYTIAVSSCSRTGDWEFACSIYNDITNNGVVPDEMFFSALIDVAGHAGNLDAAFEVLEDARTRGMKLGIMVYSSLMGACSNTKNWQKAVELYEDVKARNLNPTVSTMNALITALCDGDQLQKAMGVLSEMKKIGLCPNDITYSILFVASEKKDDLEVGLILLSQAKEDGVHFNLVMCKCLIGMCLRRYEKATKLGEPVLSFESGRPQIISKWTSLALTIYRETIGAGLNPSMEVLSQVLGCLQLPRDASLKKRIIETLGVDIEASRNANLLSLMDGFGEYDTRAFSLLEEGASLGVVPCVSFKESPILIDARNFYTHTAEVYLLTVLKGLKHRLAAGAKLPNIIILLPIETTQILSPKGERTIKVAGRITQAVGALLRRIGLRYHGSESQGKIRINGLAVKRWFTPKLAPPFSGRRTELSLSESRLGKGITHQQRNIRTGNLSLD
ncbi:hypothetical protein Ancab_028446 [Ancistrocladus abbreviatus]